MDEAICEFVAEAREGIEAVDAKLVAFEQDPANPALLDDIFRLVHSIKGTSGFLGLTRLQAVAHAAENVLGAFRDGDLAVEEHAVGAVLEAVDVVRDIIEALSVAPVEPAGSDVALIRRLDDIFAETSRLASPAAAPRADPATIVGTLLQRLGGEATVDCAIEMAMPGLIADPVHAQDLAGRDLDLVRCSLLEALCQAARDGRPLSLGSGLDFLTPGGAHALLTHLRAALSELGADPGAIEAVLVVEDGQSATAPWPADAAPTELVRSEGEGVGQTIRVGVDTLEALMTTVSELVLIRNQLIQTLREQPDSPFAGPLHRLNQVTSELQEGVMTTRMQPISGAWAKLPRLVRDLAVELGKKIDLVLTGQDTELDRQVMELIKDPLTHMIRNAADHGLETPVERLASGKPETGRIHLSARHEGGAIIVEMADDGRGLDVTRIRARAVANGLVTASQASSMSDAEVRHLIFAPGFSTADQVTTVSGRGVGMDVVRTNIEKIGGAIELSSTAGQGTRIAIRIPLTLSIVSALIVECAGERFALPQAGIVELVSAQASDGSRRIEVLNGAPVVRLRDALLPLAPLRDVLRLSAGEDARPDACIVVVRVGGFVFGVLVDRVFDTEEIVVKPTASILRNLRIYSGATILGDGAVVMILDFKGMAMEIGAGSLLNDEQRSPTEETEAVVPTESLLVFRTADGPLKAAPLSCVARIEELPGAAVEQVDGRAVIDYRGRLMPVLDVGGRPAAWEGLSPVLVFSRDELSIGVVVSEIVDIVEACVSTDLEGATPGVIGSLLLDGKATALIDVDFYWRRARGQAEPTMAATAEAESPGAGGRRLLVLDASPFTQLLVRPLLAQAGYAVQVVSTPEAALALHDEGQLFDLILTDISARGDEARRRAEALMRADRWRDTPLLGLGVQSMSSGSLSEVAGAELLADVGETLESRVA